MDARWARPWFAATAAAVLAGVVIQLFVSANSDSAFGGSPVNQALNIFAYFTVLSNVIVGVTTLLLALDPNRTSSTFALFRLIGLVAITVTFIVFHVVLSRLLDLETWAEAANQLLHTVVPILAIVGWGVFGPRGLTSARIARLTVLFPLAYMIFTVIRGPLASNFYPYPFADVHALGYLRVSINALWVALLFVGVAAAATALDPRLPAPTAAGSRGQQVTMSR
jgi:hypothetical protein